MNVYACFVPYILKIVRQGELKKADHNSYVCILSINKAQAVRKIVIYAG